MIGRELVGMAAEHVARELVEQDHGGERGQGIVEEAADRKLALLRPQVEKLLLDPVVELGRAAPPVVIAQPEPESEEVGTPVGHASAANRLMSASRSGIRMPNSVSSTAQTSAGLSSRRRSEGTPSLCVAKSKLRRVMRRPAGERATVRPWAKCESGLVEVEQLASA